jgi:hypothetical protein
MRQIIIVLLLLSWTASVSAKDVYVSNDGSDDNAGTREKPLASIQKAVAAIRAGGPGVVWLAEGEYPVAKGLVLAEEDSGTPQAPLVIRSEVPHAARITGAKKVAQFEPISPAEAATLISEEARKHVLVADLKAQGFPALLSLPDVFRAAGCEEVIFGDLPMKSSTPARRPPSTGSPAKSTARARFAFPMSAPSSGISPGACICTASGVTTGTMTP